MKKAFYIMIFALAATTLVGCGGKSDGKAALREMEKIVEKVEKEKDNLTADEWRELAASFEENEKIANKAAEENRLGLGDKMKIITLTGRWATASSGMMLGDIFSKLSEALNPEETTTDSANPASANDKRWILYYKNIVLGNQGNNTNGHFLKLKTGETVTVDEAKGQEEFLAMLFFTEKGYTLLTFPANAEDASTYREFEANRLFSQKQGGLQSWPPEKMTGGVIKQTEKIDAVTFNEIAQSKDPVRFAKAFANANGDEENLRGLSYDISIAAGKIYLVQFNNLVRGILLIKSAKSAANGSLAFDLIVEGRQSFTELDLAKYLQPDEPLENETAAAKEIKGKVSECKTGKPLGGVTIQFEDRNSEKIQTVVSNNAGEFSFVPDPTIRELEARGKKADYMSRVVRIGSADFERYKNQGTLLEICMEKVDYDKALRLDNIHYDTGKADIRPDAQPELDRLVQFLNDNPNVKVELSSHTDSRSAADYNLKLSQRRADEAKKYIVSKGIVANRIVAVGYGETRLLNRCADGVACSEEEHQLNRRTEIKMIK